MEVIRMGGLYDLCLKPSHDLRMLFVGFEFMKIYLRFGVQLSSFSFVEILVLRA
jgi:hypothetical protein